MTGSLDPVALFMSAENAASSFRSLEQHVVDGAGHWVHQQEPDEVNALLLDHLARADAEPGYWRPARTEVMRWVLKPSQCIRPT